MAQAGEFAGVDHDFFEAIDKAHGRLESRRYWITEELRTLPNREQWSGLRSIGLGERRCVIDKTETVEHRFFNCACHRNDARPLGMTTTALRSCLAESLYALALSDKVLGPAYVLNSVYTAIRVTHHIYTNLISIFRLFIQPMISKFAVSNERNSQ